MEYKFKPGQLVKLKSDSRKLAITAVFLPTVPDSNQPLYEVIDGNQESALVYESSLEDVEENSYSLYFVFPGFPQFEIAKGMTFEDADRLAQKLLKMWYKPEDWIGNGSGRYAPKGEPGSPPLLAWVTKKEGINEST